MAEAIQNTANALFMPWVVAVLLGTGYASCNSAASATPCARCSRAKRPVRVEC